MFNKKKVNVRGISSKGKNQMFILNFFMKIYPKYEHISYQLKIQSLKFNARASTSDDICFAVTQKLITLRKKKHNTQGA